MTLDVNLFSGRSIDSAIKELEKYARVLEAGCKTAQDKAAHDVSNETWDSYAGAAHYEVPTRPADAIYQRDPFFTIKRTSADDGATEVTAGGDAVFLEFGAGVYYNGAAGSSPHPKGAELGALIGGYGKGKGKQDSWNSPYYLTHGTQATCGMYNAARNAKENIRGYITEEVLKNT